jgi:pimeloyl-ACP methyl ester carboxylesterase
MSKIAINNATLVYEVLGHGPPVVFTPGGWLDMEIPRRLAEQLSSRYQVLIYDRRNCGASDIVIEDAPNEVELWADDLHALLGHLGTSPAYIGGASAGLLVSLLLAHRYPKDVKALFLHSIPTDNLQILKFLADDRYFQPAVVAEGEGMQAVIETSQWIADGVERNPTNRKRLLSMEPKEFASIMRRWGTGLTSSRSHLAGLTDEELSRLTAPVFIAPGLDEYHPLHTAEELHRLLPNSELMVYSEHFSSAEIDELRQQEIKAEAPCMIPIYDAFMARVETARS